MTRAIGLHHTAQIGLIPIPMLTQVLSIVAPVMLIAGLGFAWGRARQPFDTQMVSVLVTNIGAPCLLLSKLLTDRPDLVAMASMVASAVSVVGGLALIGYVLLRIFGQPARAFLPVMIFPNAGNMGMPLCLFAFGESGLALAVAFFSTTALLQFGLGQAIASGRADLKAFLVNPVLWAFVIAVTLLAFDATLPTWTMNTLGVLSGIVIPLMMLSLGISLASLRVSSIGRGMAMAVFRLGGGFAAALAVTSLLGLEGTARGVVLIQASMPSAVFNYMFAARYGNQPAEVAGVVLIATVLSFLTLPGLVAFVL
ncbi:MAG: AEC family transporter [Rhodobacteraceae bacterium]|nr:AEC family transporter [Paracoccaceae bacterium]